MPRILPKNQLNEVQPLPSVKAMENSLYHQDSSLNPLQVIHNRLKNISALEMEKSVFDPLNCPHVVACMEEMKRIKLEQLGLTEELLATKTSGYSMDIICAREYQMSVFVLPKGCKIPLHNHPHMTVCSKLIIGTMKLRSFTPSHSSWSFFNQDSIPASLDFDGIKSSQDEPWLLTPNKENVHEFSALTDCVILDILLPPYEEPHRPCIFYKASQKTQSQGTSLFQGFNGATITTTDTTSNTNITNTNSATTETPSHTTNSTTNTPNITASNASNWFLREMTESEQREVQMPYIYEYEGFVPSVETQQNIGFGVSVESNIATQSTHPAHPAHTQTQAVVQGSRQVHSPTPSMKLK